MNYSYYKILKTFVEQSKSNIESTTPWQIDESTTPWQIDPFEFAKSLLRLLDNPDGIQQHPFGFCGEVAFLRSWAYRDPDTITTFAIELYKTGSSHIGDYEIKAGDKLLSSTWMQNNYDAPITAAVWMICGALADTNNDFNGSPPNNSGTTTSMLANWLKKLTNIIMTQKLIHEKLMTIGCGVSSSENII